MESLSGCSLYCALDETSLQNTHVPVTKHTKQYRQQLNRLWQSSDGVDSARGCATTVEDLLVLITSKAMESAWFAATQRGLHYLDSSACAALLKELGRKGHTNEAFHIFDWLRSLDASHELSRLADVYTYTTMIAQCATAERKTKANELIQEMRQRGIECNVHTYSALLHVYAKTDQTELALGIPERMQKDGCVPNLVTFNTLINLFRKMGEWRKAVEVIDIIDNMNIQAEAKTYNSVISACSSCGEPEQALLVYQRMLAKNVQPSAATYTALISAHGKRGLVEQALTIFHDMVQRGCARNVITYSSLIGACEKTGQWQLAFELFARMKSEGIQPNIITFNSLITACANSGQWSKACDVYSYMVQDGCRPDPTTYATLLGALMKGDGHWAAALELLSDMTRTGCSRPDNAIYNAVMEILWNSGEKTAQATALQLWKSAQQAGTIKFVVRAQGAEYSVEVFTCGAAVITVFMWLVQLKSYSVGCEETVLVMKLGKRSTIEQSQTTIKEAVEGVLIGLHTPFIVTECEQTLRITSTVGDGHRAEWFASDDCQRMLRGLEEAMLTPPLSTSQLTDTAKIRSEQCTKAYQSVLDFEAQNEVSCPSVMVELSKDHSSSIVQSALFYADGLGFDEDTALDAVWLFHRVAASEHFTAEFLKQHFQIFTCMCVLLARTSMERTKSFSIPSSSGFHLEDLISVKTQIQRALSNDLRGVSPTRILSLFGEILGTCSPFGLFIKDEHNLFRRVITHVAQQSISFRIPSTLLACCIFYEVRREHQIYPHWPTEVARITGYTSALIKETVDRFPVLKEIANKQANALL